MLLEAEKLEVRYGRVRAVRQVNLRMGPGEIVTVLGANGAGKTSLLRALAGMTPLSGGRVVFDGADITGVPGAARVGRGLVLVPEGRQIFVSLTVHDNLLLGAFTRRDSDVLSDIERIYERFPNLAQRRDMLAIGRALLARPRLMMMDEPSLGLSPLLVQRLFDLIGELNTDGLSILLVEQNTQMALQAAARGYVLELGSVALEGDASALSANPALAAAYLGHAA
jgi:branched-chain amino acid transport system ATP-binding protein